MNTGERYYVKSPFTFRRLEQTRHRINSNSSPMSLTMSALPRARAERQHCLYTSTPAPSSAATPPSALDLRLGRDENLPPRRSSRCGLPAGWRANWSSGYLPPHCRAPHSV
jgi:hypothetical protein